MKGWQLILPFRLNQLNAQMRAWNLRAYKLPQAMAIAEVPATSSSSAFRPSPTRVPASKQQDTITLNGYIKKAARFLFDLWGNGSGKKLIPDHKTLFEINAVADFLCTAKSYADAFDLYYFILYYLAGTTSHLAPKLDQPFLGAAVNCAKCAFSAEQVQVARQLISYCLSSLRSRGQGRTPASCSLQLYLRSNDVSLGSLDRTDLDFLAEVNWASTELDFQARHRENIVIAVNLPWIHWDCAPLSPQSSPRSAYQHWRDFHLTDENIVALLEWAADVITRRVTAAQMIIETIEGPVEYQDYLMTLYNLFWDDWRRSCAWPSPGRLCGDQSHVLPSETFMALAMTILNSDRELMAKSHAGDVLCRSQHFFKGGIQKRLLELKVEPLLRKDPFLTAIEYVFTLNRPAVGEICLADRQSAPELTAPLGQRPVELLRKFVSEVFTEYQMSSYDSVQNAPGTSSKYFEVASMPNSTTTPGQDSFLKENEDSMQANSTTDSVYLCSGSFQSGRDSFFSLAGKIDTGFTWGTTSVSSSNAMSSSMSHSASFSNVTGFPSQHIFEDFMETD
jgi:hypothetical protein